MKLPAFIAVAGLGSLSCCQSLPTSGGDNARVAPMPAPKEIPTHANNLVDIKHVDPSIFVELRYASSNNFTGKPLYPADMPCLLNKGTARRLKLANEYLKKRGYYLKVWDAWRPPTVQRKLFEAAPDDGEWVSEPVKNWSHHNFGTGVDVTLADSKGRDQVMPTDFDELNHRASHSYHGGNSLVERNLLLLQRAMQHGGFQLVLDEWWHFYDIWARDSELTFAAELGITLPD